MASGSSVFISYAADTKPLAEELTRALENQGIEAWVDFKNLRPGQRWKDELERALGTRVRIVELSEQRGRIEIEYYSQAELDRLFQHIVGPN